MNQKYLAVRSEFLFGLACIPDIPEFDQKTLLCVLSSLSICIGNPKDGIDRRFNKQLLANSRIGEFIDSLVNSARIYLGEDNLKAENLEEGYPPRMKRGDNYEALSILESIFNITNEELKEKKILLLLFLSFFSQKYYYMKEIFNFVDNNMNEKQRERILLFVILFGILYKETLYVLSAIERLHYKDPKLLNPLTSLFPKTMGSNLSYNLGILCILFDKKEALIEFAQYVDMPLRDDFLLRWFFNESYSDYFKDLDRIYAVLHGYKNEFFLIWECLMLGVLGLLDFAKEYDIVIPIAKKGFRYAFLAEIAGVPVRVVEAHNHTGENKFKWVTKVKKEELKGKRILILEDDIASGGTLALVLQQLQRYSPGEIDVLLTGGLFIGDGGCGDARGRAQENLSQYVNIFSLQEMLKRLTWSDQFRIFQTMAQRSIAFERKIDNQLTLHEMVINLEKKLEETLKIGRGVINRKRLREFKKAFYGMLFKILSSKIGIPEVYGEAIRGLKNLDGLLDDLINKIRVNGSLPIDSSYVDVLVAQLNKDYPAEFNSREAKYISREKIRGKFYRSSKDLSSHLTDISIR